MLQFFLLGAPKLLRNGNPVGGFITRKAEALLYYLIVTERAHTRSAVAALLWPDMPEQNARKNLRDVIASLRKIVGDLLLFSNQTLALNPEYAYWADVAVVSKVLSDSKSAVLDDLREAIGLYHGEFLEGFFLLNAAPFDEWVRQKREEYHIFVLNGLHVLADRYLAANEWDAGLTATRRLLLLDPWNEQAHRKQMWLLACAGQRAAALAQYQTCVQVLADEMQLAPMAETTALYLQIRDDGFTNHQPIRQAPGRSDQVNQLRAPVSATEMPPVLLPHNLPRQLTPLIDRFHESGALHSKLQDPNYPLITLVGEGGVGKTRLALAVAQAMVDGTLHPSPRPSFRSSGLLGSAPAPGSAWSHSMLFRDGIWFVPLAHLIPGDNVPEQLATTIGMTLGMAFSGSRSPKTQLLEWLANKQILLILDNFEHFGAGVGFVIELLQSIHHLKLLITSRHRLNLQAEYVYRLEGLAIPESTDSSTWNSATILDYGSVQLFMERAGRTTPGFVLTAENQHKVLAICQFVEGLPLGIELAAALVEHNDIAVIAQALTENYALLAADLADLPPRHHSISAVLDYSWRLLATDEAEILAQCSIFQGGFTLEAVVTITGATITQLESLVHQSLLRHAEGGRFDMHELIRHYTAERLSATPAVKAAVIKRYCTYYVDLLYTNHAQLPDNRLIAAAMRQELGNIRATWTYVTAAADAAFVAKGLDGFVRCYEMAGLYKEGETLLRQTVSQFEAQMVEDEALLPEWRRLLARLWLEQGLFCLRLGYLDMAATLYQRAQDVGRQLTDAYLLAYARYRISLLMLMRGNYKAALAAGQEALAWAQHTDLLGLQANILSNIGIAYEHSGDKAQAHAYLGQALQLTRQHGTKEAEALLLINLGELHQKKGNFAEALHYHQQALFLLRRIDKQQGTALVLHYLGSLLITMGAYIEARTHLEQALAIFQQSGDSYYVELIITKLSNLFYQLELYEKAQTYSKQAVHLAARTGHQSVLAEALLYAGRIWTAQRQPAQATAAYEQALHLWQESGQVDWTMTTLAELGWLAYTEQDYTGALHHIDQILKGHTTEVLQIASDPIQVAWICYKILMVNGDPRAPTLLAEAYHQIQAQATTINDAELRQSFLEKVAANRAIIDAIRA